MAAKTGHGDATEGIFWDVRYGLRGAFATRATTKRVTSSAHQNGEWYGARSMFVPCTVPDLNRVCARRAIRRHKVW
jgi:hypothetical protein